MITKRFIEILLVAGGSLTCCQAASVEDLAVRSDKRGRDIPGTVTASAILADPEQAFLNPPETAKPGVLWMWMGCNLSREGITRDLEALKEAGYNRTTMFSLADVTTPWAGEINNSPTPEIISWTEPWWKLVRHAALESKRLGMDFGMFNGPSYESSGGPWITPELSMQEVCFSQTPVSGPGKVALNLPQPVVDPRAVQQFPVFNPNTGHVEKPEIPERKTYYRDVAVLALPASGVVAKDQVIDLTGKKEWNAPAGNWIVYCFGHTTMGTLIQPAQWKATGFECDKMSVEAVTFHMNHVIGEIKKHLGDLIGTSFTHVHFDSYEAGTPGWTPKMREEFSKRRGYDLTPFLATFAGRVIGGDAETGKFRGDFNDTILDLYRDAYFTTVRQLLHAAKLEFLCEPYGGPWRQDEIMPKVDRVMTEFWTGGGKYTPYEVDPTIAALRKSGQNIIEAEAFTGAPGDSQWTETPDWAKTIGDAAYCAGINRFILHRFAQQPWDDRYLPGATMGQWGTHFDRTQTWWKPGKALVHYWQRCQALLQWGRIAPLNFYAEGFQVGAIHRQGETADVWFVANLERGAGEAQCAFKVTGRQPELWDPVTGTRRELTDFEDDGDETTLTLEFAPAQSWFVVFRKKGSGAGVQGARRNFPALKPVTEVAGPWEVSFDPKWGGPAAVKFEQLEDWTKRTEPGIRYYSGTAIYRKTFDGATAAWLDLGTVNHIARVRLNSRDLGVVWTAPWRVSIPAGLLKTAGNQLEIEVTNVWRNRLIGDEQEPADCEWLPGHMGNGGFLKQFPDWFVKGEPRPSKGRYCFTTWNYFTKESPLAASGLLGPVRLMAEDWTGTRPKRPSSPIRSRTARSLEADVVKKPLIAIASVVEEGVVHDGGGIDASALFNGTTTNGSGRDETVNDGKTFRGYGTGSVLTLRLAKPSEVAWIHTFAVHPDGRASQNYTVLIARSAAPTKFEKLASASVRCDGGASELRVNAGTTDVVAVRFEFQDGPIGFNVYREICLVGKESRK